MTYLDPAERYWCDRFASAIIPALVVSDLNIGSVARRAYDIATACILERRNRYETQRQTPDI